MEVPAKSPRLSPAPFQGRLRQALPGNLAAIAFTSTLTLLAVVAMLTAGIAAAQSVAPLARTVITQQIDEGNLVTLGGNTRPEANAQNDRGAVAGDFQMENLMLVLRRPAALEKARKEFIDSLYDPASPNFHHWVTRQELGRRFGLSQGDLRKLANWLRAAASR